MPYTKQVWQDLSLDHPLSAVRMNYIEQGIENATTKAETADAKAIRPLNQLTAPTADVSLNNKKITSLATPTAGSDAATKDYVDGNGGVILSTVTAKGDLLVATAAGALARLGAGADGQLLVVDPTQPTGVRWANKPTLSELGAPTADVSLNSRKIINLGEPDAATDAATKAYVDANVSSAPGAAYDARQVGELMVWTGKTNPTADYALLNGQRLTKLDFPQGYDFAQAEVAAGNTDWTVRTSDETFTVPDYSNRFIYTHGAKALTTKGGTENETLTTAQIPAHIHKLVMAPISAYGDTSNGLTPGGNFGGRTLVQDWSGGATYDSTQNNTGGGGAHNNMPPYVVLAHFVKVRGAVISGDAIQGPPGPVASVVQEDWAAPTFVAQWKNVGGANYSTAGFKKAPDGKVLLKGVITPDGTAALNNTAAFTLPAGYRPSQTRRFSVYTYNGAFGAGLVTVHPTGAVHAAWSGTTPFEIALDGVQFDVDQTTFPAGKSVIPIVSALPAGPTDGDEVYFQSTAMATAGVMWHLRYRAAATGSYKWEFVGGPDLFTTHGSSTAVTTTALANVGSAVAIPLSGEYTIDFGVGLIRSNSGASYNGAQLDVMNGATVVTASVVNAVLITNGADGGSPRNTVRTTLLSSQTLQAKRQMASGTNTDFYDIRSRLTPVRVG